MSRRREAAKGVGRALVETQKSSLDTGHKSIETCCVGCSAPGGVAKRGSSTSAAPPARASPSAPSPRRLLHLRECRQAQRKCAFRVGARARAASPPRRRRRGRGCRTMCRSGAPPSPCRGTTWCPPGDADPVGLGAGRLGAPAAAAVGGCTAAGVGSSSAPSRVRSTHSACGSERGASGGRGGECGGVVMS